MVLISISVLRWGAVRTKSVARCILSRCPEQDRWCCVKTPTKYATHQSIEYTLPKYFYSLVHQRVTVGLLRKMERAVLAAVRKILYLPSDTPVPIFHKHPGEGGLAVT